MKELIEKQLEMFRGILERELTSDEIYLIGNSFKNGVAEGKQAQRKEIIQVIKNRYSKGQRVELVNMNDPYTTLKPGDKGYVDFVDDCGTVFVNWDNGSKLGIIYNKDAIKKI